MLATDKAFYEDLATARNWKALSIAITAPKRITVDKALKCMGLSACSFSTGENVMGSGNYDHALKYKPEDIEHILSERVKGIPWPEIGAQYGVAAGTIKAVVWRYRRLEQGKVENRGDFDCPDI